MDALHIQQPVQYLMSYSFVVVSRAGSDHFHVPSRTCRVAFIRSYLWKIVKLSVRLFYQSIGFFVHGGKLCHLKSDHLKETSQIKMLFVVIT